MLGFEGLGDGFGGVNVALATIDDWDIAQSERNDTPSEDIDYVCASVPETRCSVEDPVSYKKDTHIRSTFVRTPMVLTPSGSTSRAILRPSELARSWLAGETARMIQADFEIYFINISRICFSISFGWSPTGTFVSPGRSTSVNVRTFGENMRRLMGCGEIPAFRPVLASVSRTISSRIFPKS